MNDSKPKIKLHYLYLEGTNQEDLNAVLDALKKRTRPNRNFYYPISSIDVIPEILDDESPIKEGLVFSLWDKAHTESEKKIVETMTSNNTVLEGDLELFICYAGWLGTLFINEGSFVESKSLVWSMYKKLCVRADSLIKITSPDFDVESDSCFYLIQRNTSGILESTVDSNGNEDTKKARSICLNADIYRKSFPLLYRAVESKGLDLTWTKYNSFLDTTTLDEVVEQLVELYGDFFK